MPHRSQSLSPLPDADASRKPPPPPHSQSMHGPHAFSRKEQIEVQHHEAESYAKLLMLNQCYEAMPTSSKMVVFDQDLLLRKAFNGLIYQCTRHVLLSDGTKGGMITGILSVTDFIRVMLRLHRERNFLETQVTSDLANEHEDIGKLTIRTYRELILKEGKLMPLISIDADKSLLEAARLLAKHHIHRLPVMDPESGSPLFILTHKRLLKFLWCFGQQFSQPDYHIKTAKELGVGTWRGIRVVYPDTPLVDCLDILLNKGVSGLPVVERETFKVVDIYSRFDAVGIALEDRANSLDCTVEQALAFKNTFKSESEKRVVSVKDTDTLWTAITVLVERNVHRLCAVNEKDGIEGVISLSDVINHMVVLPGTNLKPRQPRRRHYTHHQGGDIKDEDLRNMLNESAMLLEEEAHSNSNSNSNSKSNLSN